MATYPKEYFHSIISRVFLRAEYELSDSDLKKVRISGNKATFAFKTKEFGPPMDAFVSELLVSVEIFKAGQPDKYGEIEVDAKVTIEPKGSSDRWTYPVYLEESATPEKDRIQQYASAMSST